jgi:hypothetical protein
MQQGKEIPSISALCLSKFPYSASYFYYYWQLIIYKCSPVFDVSARALLNGGHKKKTNFEHLSIQSQVPQA